MYEHRMKLFDGHSISIKDFTLQSAFCLYKNGRLGRMKHIMPLMAKQNKGSVINASSIAGLIGAPGHVLYGASKGAVRTMTKDAAIEYASKGVRVNSIHPGYIDTGMADYASEQTGSTKDELGKEFPLGHLGSVNNVANTVLFIASDESSYTTGTEFVIDGGATAR
ncbi:NAD(P)-dependent dehydrogenase (short-subunit alcohol dehydrogenase family) [Peribacillus sp. V2I11]|nr:NAD(P)-dependent dehydrogenase (short-subunit alcohol dehydrogenase family) [Peribacillus sp. V2I11]